MEEDKANLVDEEVDNEGHVLLMAYSEPGPTQAITWFLDIGASNHMVKKEFFTYLDEKQLDNITFGDLSQRPVEGKCVYHFLVPKWEKVAHFKCLLCSRYKKIISLVLGSCWRKGMA